MTDQEAFEAITAHVKRADEKYNYALTHACKMGNRAALAELHEALEWCQALQQVANYAQTRVWVANQAAKHAAESAS